MVCNGILPIDQLRDALGPVTHVCLTIPREALEYTYGITIIKPSAEDIDFGTVIPFAVTLCSAFM